MLPYWAPSAHGGVVGGGQRSWLKKLSMVKGLVAPSNAKFHSFNILRAFCLLHEVTKTKSPFLRGDSGLSPSQGHLGRLRTFRVFEAPDCST